MITFPILKLILPGQNAKSQAISSSKNEIISPYSHCLSLSLEIQILNHLWKWRILMLQSFNSLWEGGRHRKISSNFHLNVFEVRFALELLCFLYLHREQYQKLICGKIWRTACYLLSNDGNVHFLHFTVSVLFLQHLMWDIFKRTDFCHRSWFYRYHYCFVEWMLVLNRLTVVH